MDSELAPVMPPPLPKRQAGEPGCRSVDLHGSVTGCQAREDHPEDYHYRRWPDGSERWWYKSEDGGGWARHQPAGTLLR